MLIYAPLHRQSADAYFITILKSIKMACFSSLVALSVPLLGRLGKEMIRLSLF